MESQIRFCHKSIVQRSNPGAGSALQTLDFLLSEARVGYWRDTILHRKFVPQMIVSLQDSILGSHAVLKTKKKSLADVLLSSMWETTPLRPISTFLPKLPPLTREPLVGVHRYPFPVAPLNGEPYPGAWIKEGDTVEALYNGEFNGECFVSF